jgi:hypothetical protein
MRLLKIARADFRGRNVRSDTEDGYARSMALEQAVDEMQVARPAAAGADRKVAGEMCLGARREGGDLFMPHVNPLDRALAADCIGDTVETVADDAEYALDAGRYQGLDKLICH